MSNRLSRFEQTKQDLKDALARLVDGTPTNIELREKIRQGKVIKINNLNVEKEANKGNQALKRHPELKIEIEKLESQRLYGKETKVTSDGVDPVLQRTKVRLDKAIEQRKKLASNQSSLKEEIERKDQILKSQIEHMDEMFAALWEVIPQDQVESRMESIKTLAKVIDINFKSK